MARKSRPKPLTLEVAKARAIELYNEGFVRPTIPHFPERMTEWGIIDWDLIHVITHGLILYKPRWDRTFSEWRYRVIGEDLNGNRLAVVFSIDENVPELVMIICGRW